MQADSKNKITLKTVDIAELMEEGDWVFWRMTSGDFDSAPITGDDIGKPVGDIFNVIISDAIVVVRPENET